MEPTPRSRFWARPAFPLTLVAVELVATGGWLYYDARLREIPPLPQTMPQGALPHATLIAVAGSASPATAVPITPPETAGHVPEVVRFSPPGDPLKGFHQELHDALLAELGDAFPELRDSLGMQTTKSADPAYRLLVLRLLKAAANKPVEERPVYFFAAELVAQEIWCAMENKAECDQLRAEFATYQLSLKGAALGGVFVYGHDLLWRLWRDYPASDWGQKAFVLLLNDGWDTSPTCENGADQTRVVIRQGEAFLHRYPKSAYVGAVTILVAEAYASWWSLSQPDETVVDYVDPAAFRPGAEGARVKAIEYFEQVLRLVPRTEFSDFANLVLPHLREKQVLDDNRFFCIYD